MVLLHGCHSYILLTANLDDVHAIARQIAASPVAGQINSIFRRASTIFNQQLRAGDDAGYQRELRRPRANTLESYSSEPIPDNRIERRSQKHQTSHHSPGHNRRSNTGGEISDNGDSKTNQSSEIKERLTTSIPVNKEVDNHVESNAASDHDNFEEQTSVDKSIMHENHHSGESILKNDVIKAIDYNINNTEVEHGGADEHPRIKGHLSVEKDEVGQGEASNTDDVVALGKNASFYLNSMKKIMENI